LVAHKGSDFVADFQNLGCGLVFEGMVVGRTGDGMQEMDWSGAWFVENYFKNYTRVRFIFLSSIQIRF
jgi:hypothetical protein